MYKACLLVWSQIPPSCRKQCSFGWFLKHYCNVRWVVAILRTGVFQTSSGQRLTILCANFGPRCRPIYNSFWMLIWILIWMHHKYVIICSLSVQKTMSRIWNHEMQLRINISRHLGKISSLISASFLNFLQMTLLLKSTISLILV